MCSVCWISCHLPRRIISVFYQELIVKQRTVPVFNAEIYKFNLWSPHKRELGVMKQVKAQ